MISSKTNQKFEVKNDSGKMIFDSSEPKSAGGNGKYPRPTELLLGALGSCLNVTICSIAEREGYKIDSLKVIISTDVETKGVINEQIKDGFYNMKIKFDMKSNIPVSKQEQFLQKCLTACPVHSVVENPTNIEWDY